MGAERGHLVMVIPEYFREFIEDLVKVRAFFTVRAYKGGVVCRAWCSAKKWCKCADCGDAWQRSLMCKASRYTPTVFPVTSGGNSGFIRDRYAGAFG